MEQSNRKCKDQIFLKERRFIWYGYPLDNGRGESLPIIWFTETTQNQPFWEKKTIGHQRRWISFTQVCCWDHQLSSSIMARCPSWLYIFSPSINCFAKRATRPQSYCDLPWGDQPSILISNLWKNRLVKILCLCIRGTWEIFCHYFSSVLFCITFCDYGSSL